MISSIYIKHSYKSESKKDGSFRYKWVWFCFWPVASHFGNQISIFCKHIFVWVRFLKKIECGTFQRKYFSLQYVSFSGKDYSTFGKLFTIEKNLFIVKKIGKLKMMYFVSLSIVCVSARAPTWRVKHAQFSIMLSLQSILLWIFFHWSFKSFIIVWNHEFESLCDTPFHGCGIFNCW